MHKWNGIFVFALLLVPAVLSTQGQTTSKRLDVGGNFRILNVTQSGADQVTLSVALDFANQSSEALQITDLAYLPDLPVKAEGGRAAFRSQAQPLAAPMALEMRAHARSEEQVQLSAAEFAQLDRREALRFVATLTRADGSAQKQIVVFRNARRGRPQ